MTKTTMVVHLIRVNLAKLIVSWIVLIPYTCGGKLFLSRQTMPISLPVHISIIRLYREVYPRATYIILALKS